MDGTKLNILVVTNLFEPDRGGGASVFTDLCVGLVERGHRVTAYTTYPYYPEWINKSKARLTRVSQDDHHGVSVLRYGMYIPRDPTRPVERLLYELSFFFSLSRSLFRRSRYDLVMVYCPLFGAVLYGALRRGLTRETMWLNVQDVPADAAVTTGLFRGRSLGNAATWAQGWAFNRYDAWSTIAPEMVGRLEAIRRRAQPIVYLPNFLNRSMASLTDAARRRRPPPRARTRLLYAGNVGGKQDLLRFCQALHATSLDIELVIHGDGSEAGRVQEWVRATRDPRISYGPFLDEPAFVEALSAADIFVITEASGIGASFIPSKLIPCLAVGTPVLAVTDRSSPLGAEIERSAVGTVLEWPELDAGLDQAVIHLTDPVIVDRLRRNTAVRAQDFTRDRVLDRLEKALSEPSMGSRSRGRTPGSSVRVWERSASTESSGAGRLR